MNKRRRTNSTTSRQDEEMSEDMQLEPSPTVSLGGRKRKRPDPVSNPKSPNQTSH